MTSIIQSNCAFHWFYFSGDIFAGDRHFLFKIVTLHGISWFFAGDRHRMPSRAYTSFLLTVRQVMWALRMKPCQCPLGLIPHFYCKKVKTPNPSIQKGVNALSGLYLISTVPLQKPRFYAVSRACFCRYLSEYSDNSCFSCMLTFWTYLMRCTYP